MKKHTVGLVDLGERLPLSLKALAKKLNSLQVSFEFDDAGVITSDALGDPDVEGKWYDIPRLFVLVGRLAPSRYDYVVGVTNCRITHLEEQPPSTDLDYFSRSDFKKVAIISVNKSLLKYHSAGKTTVQFAGFLLMAEVAIMSAKKNLTHYGNPHCVFNECEDKELLSDCIESGEICATCVNEIKKANIPDSTLATFRKVMRWCGTNSWRLAFARTIQHPVTGLALGVGIGWFTSVFAGKDYYPLMLGLMSLPICVVLYLAKKSYAYRKA
jgi:hypothetical protein